MKCTFCNRDIEKGKMRIFVTKTNRILYFCSPKCEKNLALKRKPRKLKWITREIKKKPENK